MTGPAWPASSLGGPGVPCLNHRWPALYLRHGHAWTPDALRALLRAGGAERFATRKGVLDDAEVERIVAQAPRYPILWMRGGRHPDPLHVTLRTHGSRRLSTGRQARFPAFEREPERWVGVSPGSNARRHENTADMAELMDAAAFLLPHLSPSFGFGDVDLAVAKWIGEDPSRMAWPWMLFGPALVARFGRERLLASPAQIVREAPGGAIWLQVDENPFMAQQADVRRLAKHLGLKAPR